MRQRLKGTPTYIQEMLNVNKTESLLKKSCAEPVIAKEKDKAGEISYYLQNLMTWIDGLAEELAHLEESLEPILLLKEAADPISEETQPVNITPMGTSLCKMTTAVQILCQYVTDIQRRIAL